MFVSPPMYRFRVTTPAARAGLAPWRPTRHTATTITDAITTRRRLTLLSMRPPPGGTRPFRPPGSLVRGGRVFPLGGRPGLGRAGTGHHDWRAPQSRAPGGPTAPTGPRRCRRKARHAHAGRKDPRGRTSEAPGASPPRADPRARMDGDAGIPQPGGSPGTGHDLGMGDAQRDIGDRVHAPRDVRRRRLLLRDPG